MVSLYKAHMYCSDISSEEPTVYIFCLSFKKEWEIIFQMIQPFKPGRERVKKEPRLKRDLNLNPLWGQCKLTYERLFFRCESRSWIYFPTFSSALLCLEQIPNTELINEHLILKTDWYCLSLITIVIAIKQFLQNLNLYFSYIYSHLIQSTSWQYQLLNYLNYLAFKVLFCGAIMVFEYQL